ncbi:hypothetical protein Tco_0238480 [Tanacetum coccineum]
MYTRLIAAIKPCLSRLYVVHISSASFSWQITSDHKSFRKLNSPTASEQSSSKAEMEILIPAEPASNKLLVVTAKILYEIKLWYNGYRSGPVNELTVDEF